MRSAIVAAGLVLAIISTAATTDAQVRGRLTSRPQTPSAAPRQSSMPLHPRSSTARLHPFLIWSPWAVTTVPEVALDQAPIADGAPNGGVQLDFQPWSAEVYVDGARAGRVEQFRGYYQHLALPAGPHTIAIVAAGYEPFIFGVMVMPGKTLTYRATLQR